jgi:LysM repeat protein
VPRLTFIVPFLLSLLSAPALAAVTVKHGDTLYSVSQRSGVSVARLRAINGLSGTTIHIGQILKASWGTATASPNRRAALTGQAPVKPHTAVTSRPVKRATAQTPALNSPPLKTQVRRAQALPTRPTRLTGRYTVRPGDTLSKLSKRSGVSVSTLQRSNHLRGTLLRVGQRLSLSPSTPVTTARPTTESRTVFAYSTVGKLDTFKTLSRVAQRSAQLSPAQFMKLNKLASPWVYPGMKLLMPRRVSVPIPPAPQGARASLQSRTVLGIPVKVVRVNLRYRNVLVSPVLPASGLGSSARVSTLAQLSGAAAVINGSYFHPRSYAPAGDLVVHGQRVAWGRLPAALSITPDNRARIGSGVGGTWAGMESVIASGPQIVRGGAVQRHYPAVFQDPALFGKAARSAIGLSSDRDLLLVSTRTPLSITEMGKVMAALGARDALLLDGGSSTSLSWNRSAVIGSGRKVSYGIGVFLDYSGRRYSRL